MNGELRKNLCALGILAASVVMGLVVAAIWFGSMSVAESFSATAFFALIYFTGVGALLWGASQ